MSILVIIGIVAIAVGLLALLGAISIALIPSIVIIVVGFILIFVGASGTRFTR